ncbi:hypothetical protein [Kitasatospora aureofaciens]|uniref:hypothetical protein n=1 Tax=Kitasatospora aureofaciens TaxID=1894 RepID=UPI0036F47038
MSEQRFASWASELLQAALNSWRCGNERFAVLHAGMGCEHALKALLYQANPLLISERNDRANRFHSLGLGSQKGVPPLSQARTLGLADTFKDAEIVMEGRMPVSWNEFVPLMDDRNGVAHFAYHDAARTEQSLAIAIKVAEVARKELAVASGDFWGIYDGLFGDLAKVKAMVAPTSSQVGIEGSAEALARVEASEVVEAAGHVAAIIADATVPGSALRTGAQQGEIREMVIRATVCSTLAAVARRGQRAAEALLVANDLLPLPSIEIRHYYSLTELSYEEQYRRWRDSLGSRKRQAAQVLGVRTLVARAVVQTFMETMCQQLPDFAPPWHWFISVSKAPGRTLMRVACPACPGEVRGELRGYIEVDGCCCDEGRYCNHLNCRQAVARIGAFCCPVCSLELTDPDELEAAGFELHLDWEG